MYISSYQNMLMEIKNKILNNKLKYKNSIIVGDNSSGKSEILKHILIDKKNGYYFIDSVNRTFDYIKVSSLEDLKESYKNVLKFRLSDKKFNLEDSFDVYENGLGVIEQVYFNYEEKLKKLLKDFLNIDFDIRREQDKILGATYKVYINDHIDKISSGYQAIIRLFLEIIYFEDTLESTERSPVIVIDEINEFLSTKNESSILPFLIKKFPKLNFILTTHSVDVIASAINFNIIVLKDNNYEILDGDDFTTVTDVREIFEKIYNMDKDIDGEVQDIEMTLRNLLNAKISGKWTEIEAEKMDKIQKCKLTNVQNLLLEQIKSW